MFARGDVLPIGADSMAHTLEIMATSSELAVLSSEAVSPTNRLWSGPAMATGGSLQVPTLTKQPPLELLLLELPVELLLLELL